MDIGINNLNNAARAKQSCDNRQAEVTSENHSFLSAAKKTISRLAPAPARGSEHSAPAGFKRLKETSEIDKPRTEDDVIADIEKLIRRVEKSKKTCKNHGRNNDE